MLSLWNFTATCFSGVAFTKRTIEKPMPTKIVASSFKFWAWRS